MAGVGPGPRRALGSRTGVAGSCSGRSLVRRGCIQYGCVMEAVRTLTIKNLPARVHARLVARAASHHRSLNGEVVASLTAAVEAAVVDPDQLLASARRLRATFVGRVAPAALRKLKATGRR